MRTYDFGSEMGIESVDGYEYMRLTHTLAVFWGLPITRKQINGAGEPGKKSIVTGKYRIILTIIKISE